MSEERPLLADGSVVESYEPLYKYWEAAKRRGIEEARITSEDLELVREIVERGGKVSLYELLETLAERMLERVDEGAAAEAYASLGIELPRDLARKRIAEILAGWAIEACQTLNMVSIRGWRRG